MPGVAALPSRSYGVSNIRQSQLIPGDSGRAAPHNPWRLGDSRSGRSPSCVPHGAQRTTLFALNQSDKQCFSEFTSASFRVDRIETDVKCETSCRNAAPIFDYDLTGVNGTRRYTASSVRSSSKLGRQFGSDAAHYAPRCVRDAWQISTQQLREKGIHNGRYQRREDDCC